VRDIVAHRARLARGRSVGVMIGRHGAAGAEEELRQSREQLRISPPSGMGSQEERATISRHHDDLGQALTALKSELAALRQAPRGRLFRGAGGPASMATRELVHGHGRPRPISPRSSARAPRRPGPVAASEWQSRVSAPDRGRVQVAFRPGRHPNCPGGGHDLLSHVQESLDQVAATRARIAQRSGSAATPGA